MSKGSTIDIYVGTRRVLVRADEHLSQACCEDFCMAYNEGALGFRQDEDVLMYLDDDDDPSEINVELSIQQGDGFSERHPIKHCPFCGKKITVNTTVEEDE